ncbi:hypothetical protein IG631_23604 [Alternaria alternata]|nr:hypothetical protein IG631_23604 [Alternaria alternata]
MASIHARALPAGLALLAYAAVSNAGSEGKECISSASRRRLPCFTVSSEKRPRVYCITAILLLLYFAGHVFFVCRLHSNISLAVSGLLSPSDPNMSVNCRNSDLLPNSFSGRIGVSQIWHLRDEKEAWLRGWLSLDSDSEKGQPSDSAIAVLTLLLSCIATLFLGAQFVNTLAAEDTGSWQSPLHAGYILLPLSTSAAGLIAVQLHGCGCTSAVFHGQALFASVLSTFHLLCFTLPVFVLTRWATAPGPSLEFFDVHQLGLLAIASLLPLYPMQRGSDDWYVCSHLPAGTHRLLAACTSFCTALTSVPVRRNRRDPKTAHGAQHGTGIHLHFCSRLPLSDHLVLRCTAIAVT